MEFKPHEYQRYATQFIIDHPVAAVFLDLGLGKTALTLMAIWTLVLDSFEVSRVLVICPKRVGTNTWPSEIRKWKESLPGLTFAVAIGSPAERIRALKERTHVTIINRENVPWLIEKSGQPFDYDMVVVDELSSFKSWRAKRFRSLMSVRPEIRRIVGLTATPASSNSLCDLWAEFRLLDLGSRLGRFIGRFREAYLVPDKRNGQVIFSYKPKPGAEEQIYDRISDVTISMRSVDYLDMPDLVKNRVDVELSAGEREEYDRLRDDMVLTLGEQEIDAMNAAALSGKLLQMAAGCVYTEDGGRILVHDRKLDALEDICESANGENVLVSVWFKSDMDRIRDRLPQAKELKSDQDITDWNEGKIPVGVIHPMSMGMGVNLQHGGHILVFFTTPWSSELYSQTVGRIYRQGQDSGVVSVINIVAKDTIDEAVLAAQERKGRTLDALLDAVRAELGR